MFDILTNVIRVLGCAGICYLGYLGLKLVVTILICKHPELSEKKVQYITRMVTKDKHQSK
nr:MAG TPA: hypothetical protein [Bacteriophage sp.]